MDKLINFIPSIAFNPIDISNILVGTLLSLASGALVSYVFFKLGNGPEKIASYMSHEIALMNLKQQLLRIPAQRDRPFQQYDRSFQMDCDR